MLGPRSLVLTPDSEVEILMQLRGAASTPYQDIEGLERDLKLALAFCEAGAPGVGDILRIVMRRLEAVPEAAHEETTDMVAEAPTC